MSEPRYGIRPPTDFTRLLDVLRQYRIIGFDDDPAGPLELAVIIRTRRKPARPASEPLPDPSRLPSRPSCHDAAHAAVFWSCEMGRILSLRLHLDEEEEEDGSYLGAVMHYAPKGGEGYDLNMILMAAAGAIAEELIFGTSNYSASADDRAVIEKHGGFDSATKATCREIVETLKPFILALARRLDAIEFMDGPDVEQFLDRIEAQGVPQDDQGDEDEDELGADAQDMDLPYEYRDGEFDSELPYTARSN